MKQHPPHSTSPVKSSKDVSLPLSFFSMRPTKNSYLDQGIHIERLSTWWLFLWHQSPELQDQNSSDTLAQYAHCRWLYLDSFRGKKSTKNSCKFAEAAQLFGLTNNLEKAKLSNNLGSNIWSPGCHHCHLYPKIVHRRCTNLQGMLSAI